MNDIKPIQEFYTAAEAQKVLGLTEATFFHWVRAGKIPRAARSKYAKNIIDALAQAIQLLFDDEHIVFSRSTVGEQEEDMQIGIKCFGSEFITPLPERIAFQIKSEYTFLSLKVDGHVVGYISMFRFPEQFLDDLLTGRRIEREISVREVLPFTRGEPFDIYIDVMAVDPTLSPHLQKVYAGCILKRFANKLLDLLANRYQIRTAYTVSATPEGDTLVRKVGFHLMDGKSTALGRIAYQFHLDKEGIERLKELSRREIIL